MEENHQLAPTATFRVKFYDALNRNGNELNVRILSIKALQDAFQEYNALSNTDFD